jgi:hypothetical protein
MILALDLALTTGYAFAKDGRMFESGIVDFREYRGTKHNGHAFLALWGWLRAHLPVQPEGEHDLQLAFEVAHHRGGAATRLGVGWQATVLHFAARYQLPDPIGVPTMTLKKLATGSGKSDKRYMIAEATKHLGRAPVDDNEADAVCLAMVTDRIHRTAT